MARELKPCPFCKEVPSTGLCGNRVMHDCKTLKAFISAAVEDWNTRYKRTCKPHIWMDDQITESIQRWLAECDCGAILAEGTSRYEISLRLPNHCACCGVAICGAEVADA